MRRGQIAALVASLIVLLDDCSYGPYVVYDAALADSALTALHEAQASEET
mgnify:CR=1 FL=1